MKVRREGKANHYFHREPCGGTREGAVEASVAARVAGMIEHRKCYGPECRGFLIGRRRHLQDRSGEALRGSALSEESMDARARTPLRRDSGGLRLAPAVVPARRPGVATVPLFHACRRHYPGGAGRCARRSLPGRWQPAPLFGGSASALPVSRPARRSLALRPSWSLSRPTRPVAPECFSRSRYLLQPLRLLPAGATVAGRGSHPLGKGAFPRRTLPS